MLAVATVSPGPATAAPPGSFSASSSSAALELAILAANPSNPQAVTTLGVTSAEITSAPLAKSRGAGVCEVLASGENLTNVPCSTTSTQTAESASGANDPPRKCDQGLPPPLGSVVVMQSACGDARAQVVGGDPLADSLGEVSRMEMKLDLSPLFSNLEGAKDQLISQIGAVLGPVIPDTLESALVGSLSGNATAVAALVGNTFSTSSSSGSVVKARADAAGTAVGLLGVPVCNPDCTTNPDPVTNGVIMIGMSDAFAEATWDGSAHAGADAKASVVTIFVRDLTKPAERAYLTPVTLTPSQPSTTVLGGTPLETTITIAAPITNLSNETRKGSATATVGGVEIHALKGLAESPAGARNGGIRIRVASASAALQGETPPLPSSPPGLPRTGSKPAGMAFGAILLVAALMLARSLLSENQDLLAASRSSSGWSNLGGSLR